MTKNATKQKLSALNILGVRIDNLEKKEILRRIKNCLIGNNFYQIATVNPEIILAAQKDEEYKKVLNSCDLNVADGIGIKLAFWRYGKKLKTRITGADLMGEILRIANNKGLKVFLTVNKNGLSSYEEVSASIKKVYPTIKISGVNWDKEISPSQFQIDNFEGCKVIFCNFGHPHQELFLNKQKDAIIGVAMGVGGSFDFWTGKQRRAPFWMRKIGLEWFFRLIQQPKRIKRIFNAIVIFPLKLIFNNK